VLTDRSGPRGLRVSGRPVPSAGSNQVLVDVRAAGVNFADLLATQGLYPDAPKRPCVLGYEVAGTVAEVGSGVRGVAVGDRVLGPTWFGGWAERAVVASDNLLPLPEHFGFEEGAALPVNYGTAYAALISYGALKQGERVLVHAAGGGVGVAATQIAKAHNAEVWGTASPAKHQAIRAIGVDHPLDYTRRGWHRSVPPLDIAMDPLGGRSLRRSYRMLRAGGRLVCFGTSQAVSGESRDLLAAARSVLTVPRFDPLRHLMMDSKTVIGLKMNTLWAEHDTLAPFISGLTSLLSAEALKPVIAEAIPFSRAPDALRLLAERRNVGKIVLVP
jgi:NADPH:quinone reductase-like Zn-dependent oxidoreductase